MSEQFWFQDPAVLYEDWMQFVPLQTMTTAEGLNAVLRFAIYASVLLFVATGCQSYLAAIPVVALATIILHKLFPNGKTLEAFLDLGSVFGPSRASRPEKKELTRENFTMPTVDNPFMNVQLTDIQDNPNRPDAAPITDKRVRKAINQAFAQTRNIYMDTSDRFDQTQAQRTFHTLQSAKVPNDQDAFLAWMAKGYDAPDVSSAAPARGGKLLSEGYVNARGAMRNLSTSTCPPKGTTPLGSASK
jgi:hypothetical protein